MQVRDLDASVQERLRKSAAREGLSLSAFLRRELTDLAQKLEVRERATRLNQERVRNALGGPFVGLEGISSEEIVRMIREDRDSR